MRHYTEQEWLAYKQGLISQPESEQMENHLLDCDQCMDLFLLQINEVEIARANSIIPSNFSQTTMTFIKQKQVNKPSPIHRRSKIQKLLSYYVVAAAITLLLVSGGVFQTAIDDVAAMPVVPAPQSEQQPDSLIFTWPHMLAEKSSSWTHLISVKSNYLKEVIR